MIEVVTQFRCPTKYDNEAYGTLWKEMVNDSDILYYIQASKENSNVMWLPLGVFLEHIYKALYPREEDLKSTLTLLIYSLDKNSTSVDG